MLPTRLTFTISILIPISFLASRFSIARLGLGSVEEGQREDSIENAGMGSQWWWLREEREQGTSSSALGGVKAEDTGLTGSEGCQLSEETVATESGQSEQLRDPSCEDPSSDLEDDNLVLELDKLTALVLRDFVDDWYKLTISQDDKEFSRHVRTIVRNLVRALARRLRALDAASLAGLLQRCLVLLRQHIRCYRHCKHTQPSSAPSALGGGRADEISPHMQAREAAGAASVAERPGLARHDDPMLAGHNDPQLAGDTLSCDEEICGQGGGGVVNASDGGGGSSARTRSVASHSDAHQDRSPTAEVDGDEMSASGSDALAEAIAKQYQEHVSDPVPGMLHPGSLSLAEEVRYWRAVLGALFHILLPGVPLTGSLPSGWAEGVPPGANEYVDAMRSGVIAIVREILAGRVMSYCVSNLADRFNQLIIQATMEVGKEAYAAAGCDNSGNADGLRGSGKDVAGVDEALQSLEDTELAPTAQPTVQRRSSGRHRRVQSDGGIFSGRVNLGHEGVVPDAGGLGAVKENVRPQRAEDAAAAATEKRKRALSPFRKDGVVSTWFRGRRRRSQSEERMPAQSGETLIEDGEVDALVSLWWADDFDLEEELHRNESYIGGIDSGGGRGGAGRHLMCTRVQGEDDGDGYADGDGQMPVPEAGRGARAAGIAASEEDGRGEEEGGEGDGSGAGSQGYGVAAIAADDVRDEEGRADQEADGLQVRGSEPNEQTVPRPQSFPPTSLSASHQGDGIEPDDSVVKVEIVSARVVTVNDLEGGTGGGGEGGGVGVGRRGRAERYAVYTMEVLGHSG